MKDKETVLYDEGGYKVVLSRANRFEVSGGDLDDDFSTAFDTYQQAIDKIEKARSAARKRSKRKMALAVFSDKGDLATITGLHASRGVLLTTPAKLEGRKSLIGSNYLDYGREPDFYPAVPVVLTLLGEQDRLEKALAAVRKKLGRIEIRGVDRVDNETYDREMDALDARYAARKVLAENMTQEAAEAAE